MKILSKLLMLIAFFGISCELKAQVISGTWKGNYSKTNFSFNPQSLYIEFFVSNDSVITGASHLYYSNNRYEHHKITGKFSVKDSTLLFSESLIGTNLGSGVYDVTYKMKLMFINDTWRLEGRWKGNESLFGFLPFHKVWLEKPKDTIAKTERINIALPKNSDGPDLTWEERIPDIQKIIEVSHAEKDSIRISVYDNGEIDGDSVSVYLNDSMIVENKIISDKPIDFYLSLDKSKQFQKIKMVAINLGAIPPNTALMIVTTNKKRYEVRLTSNFEKNAVVEFVLLE